MGKMPVTSRVAGSKARVETLEDHLIGIFGGAGALFRRAHCPCQQRTLENVSRNPWSYGWKFVHPVSDKMRPGAEGMTQMGHRRALDWRRLGPIRFRVVALGHDAARA